MNPLVWLWGRWRLRRNPRAGAPKAQSVGPEFRCAKPESTDQRLRRIVELCLTGQVARAEIELHQWRREENSPPAVRTLLAALLAKRHRLDDARAVLNHLPKAQINRDIAQDAGLGQMLIALQVAADMPQAARQTVLQLFAHHGHEPAVAEFLNALQPPGCEELPAFSQAMTEHLAVELLARPHLLPTLVSAQKLMPQAADIALLRQAGLRLSRDLDQGRKGLVICQAMAELALLAQDADDARRWAHRGLKLDPYCASLALVLAKIADDPAVGPPAVDVLVQVAQANPNYPDVLAALIRREKDAGQTDVARHRLHAWLAQDPANPTAQKLRQELAA